MVKHMELRFAAPDEVLVKLMEEKAAEMEEYGYEAIGKLIEQPHEISELDYIISRIDAIQAELWRRQMKKEHE